MQSKKRKLGQNQSTLSEMFARQSSVNPTVDTGTGGAQESKQNFLIDLEIVQESECGTDWTLLFHFDSHLLSGTTSQRIESESEVEIESAGRSASTSREPTPMPQFDLESQQNADIGGNNSDDEGVASMLFVNTINLTDANLYVDCS